MKRIHIIGRKNHGKTTLIVDLLRKYSLAACGWDASSTLPIATSWIRPAKTPIAIAGPHQPAAIITPDLLGIYLAPGGADPYGLMASLFAGCDLVLVEGNVKASAPKVEVWRQQIGGDCLAAAHDNVLAVISDDRAEVRVPVLARRNLETLSYRIMDMAGPASPRSGTRRPPTRSTFGKHGRLAVPGRTAAVVLAAHPTAAAQHACRAGGRAVRILGRARDRSDRRNNRCTTRQRSRACRKAPRDWVASASPGASSSPHWP